MKTLRMQWMAWRERWAADRLRKAGAFRQTAAERRLEQAVQVLQAERASLVQAASNTEAALREQIASLQSELRIARAELVLLESLVERSRKMVEADIAAECKREAMGEPRRTKP